jgi:DegV family protein with EDD domain
MAEVKVIADSSVCLPRELIDRYDIALVPEVIIFGDKVYRDGVDLPHGEFFTLLKQAKELPTTSAPSPRDFSDAYQRAAQEAGSIACILVTAGFSAMGLQSAITAREAFSEVPIEIFDSRTAVGAYGFVVLAAARAAASGKSLPEVIEAAEDVRSRVTVILTLETLEYLAKGGRIGKAAFWAGTLLNIKPVLEVPPSSGVLEPLERVRTRPKALNRLVELMEERVGNERPVHVNIDHGNVPDDADWLKAQVMSRFECAEIYINHFAPVAGAHTGPGVIALSFYTGD